MGAGNTRGRVRMKQRTAPAARAIGGEAHASAGRRLRWPAEAMRIYGTYGTGIEPGGQVFETSPGLFQVSQGPFTCDADQFTVSFATEGITAHYIFDRNG